MKQGEAHRKYTSSLIPGCKVSGYPNETEGCGRSIIKPLSEVRYAEIKCAELTLSRLLIYSCGSMSRPLRSLIQSV